MTTDTPLDSCPHCGAEQKFPFAEENAGIHFRKFSCGFMEDSWFFYRPDLCREREARQKAEAEVERLRKEIILREDMDNVAQEAWDEMKAEVKEIRVALGDDGRRTHKEILELATKASQWREWKKKYIDLKNAHMAEGQDPDGTIWEHADKLQKELATSKSEVERLETQLAKAHEELCQAGLREYGN